jgi:soluble lytic murein transglycosylase-like protein
MMTRTRTLLLCAAASVALCAITPTASHAATAHRDNVVALVDAKAREMGVPIALARKTAKAESSFRCNAVGPRTRQGHAQGPLQIMPRSARGLGHKGGPLNNCGAGLHYGMKHLAMCYRLAGGNQQLAFRCHQGGPGVIARRARSR